ncbi:hypothetical protein [Pseudoflavonifractor phocaeensis]|uniref:hypothetical protein n=1 Tax=Pseudoflavonifractor phocaeensis TaxID=1870988 RepID=UPI00195D8F81|nr:hypothetical protein [Pseudoflavonifractor phocaeensis]MBM6721520.1 hypothetical protein [Pseudoflavonifractor phocaeensis]
MKLFRQMMSNWLLKATETWLQPIYDVSAPTTVQGGSAVHGKATLQVLKENAGLFFYLVTVDTTRKETPILCSPATSIRTIGDPISTRVLPCCMPWIVSLTMSQF